VQGTDGDVLREEELELVVGELAQLRTEHIMDADVVCIAPASVAASVTHIACLGAQHNSRKIGDSQRRVRVEVVRLYEALKQIPTHLGRLIGAQGGRARAWGGRGRGAPFDTIYN
jgi:hypothetical protein